MEGMIAYCGLDCAVCPAYVATQAGDLDAQEELLAKWRVEFNSPEMDFSAVVCDGCASAGRHGGYCAFCELRACAIERGLANCAHCPDYDCAKMRTITGVSAQAAQALAAIRQSL